ncbi:MAG: serine/threonine protein kinase, partial [Phycisphaerae bacterium]
MRTDIGQLIGTIPYMSPEQVRGDSSAIDQRSDVYALGVILYELLADRLPLDVRHQSIPEAARIIRDEEPTRLSSLHSQFRGDIDTIVAKALEKDPNRRYMSAGAMADDIRRFLRDEPIVARPATTWYQILKFARRHRELVAGLALTFVTLMVGLVVVANYAMRESRLRVVADENAERSQRNELEARRAAYRANISAAAASIESHEIATARARLDAAPPELRGWEWHYLAG